MSSTQQKALAVKPAITKKTAWLEFIGARHKANALRPEYGKEKLKVTEVLQRAATRWQKMSTEEKDVFEKLAQETNKQRAAEVQEDLEEDELDRLTEAFLAATKPSDYDSEDEEEDVLLDLLKKEQDAACILIKVDGTIEKVLEPFSSRKQGYLDLAKCRQLLDCKYIQMVPCTVAVPEGKYEIVLDEEGQINGSEYNHAASSILGTQTVGDMFGNVLLFKAGALE
jgi:hypothetical protein